MGRLRAAACPVGRGRDLVHGCHVRRIADGGGTLPDEWMAGLAGGTLLGRLPTLDEVAEYLAFAASDRVSSMTGVISNPTAGALVD